MADRITAQDDTAVQGSGSSLLIETEGGKAHIRPSTPAQLSGFVDFVIDTSSAGNANLHSVEVNFSGQSACVESVTIHQVNEEIFKQDRLQKANSFALGIPSGRATLSGEEITVSIEVLFATLTSNIKVNSVNVGI